jgi:ABC-type sulfate transport system substrate-binding protein
MNDVEVICRYSYRVKWHDLISKMSDSYPSIRIRAQGTYSHAQKSIAASMFSSGMKTLSTFLSYDS